MMFQPLQGHVQVQVKYEIAYKYKSLKSKWEFKNLKAC